VKDVVLLHKYYLRDYESQIWEEKAKVEVRRSGFRDKKHLFIGWKKGKE